MHIGDFFKSATHANPVNPKPVEFTCTTNAETLPDGSKNPTRRQIRAKVKGALIFLGADGVFDARIAARRALRERLDRNAEENTPPEPLDPGDLDLEVMYQILQRAIREWDDANKRAGDPLFPTVEAVRELVIPREANRVYTLYSNYVVEEHPEEAPSEETFRKAQGRGGRVAR